MDVSSYEEMLDRGYIYYNDKKEPVDILEYAIEKGFNYGRIRIWNEPSNMPESGGYCGFESTVKLAKRMKELDIPYLLDFHYSDWWADPGKQKKPKAWEELHGVELEDAVYEYTKNVLDSLALSELSPEMVQVGNEIRCGMLWPDGSTENFSELARLVDAGIRGVRDSIGGKDIKIMIHLDQGGRYHYFEEWFDSLIQFGVNDFDIIGLSYYPFWHGTYKDLDETMNRLAERYNKDLIVAETAYAYRLASDSLFGKGQERLGGYLASDSGQKKALQIVSGIISGVKDNKGLGFFYWEPFMRDENPSSWGYCMGVVDENGNPLSALTDLDKDVLIDVDEARKMYSAVNYASDNEEPLEGDEILTDASFDAKMLGWNFTKPTNLTFEIKTEPDSSVFAFESKGNIKFNIEKDVEIQENGTYTLAVDYRGDNTTGVCIKLYIKFSDYTRETNIYPSDTLWTRGMITEEIPCNTKIKVGIEVDSPEVWGEIKELHLLKGEA